MTSTEPTASNQTSQPTISAGLIMQLMVTAYVTAITVSEVQAAFADHAQATTTRIAEMLTRITEWEDAL